MSQADSARRHSVDPLAVALWWKADVEFARLNLPPAPVQPSGQGPSPRPAGADAAGHAFETALAALANEHPRRGRISPDVVKTIARHGDPLTASHAADILAEAALEHGHVSLARGFLEMGEATRHAARHTVEGQARNRIRARVLIAEALASDLRSERQALAEQALHFAFRAERYSTLRPETRNDPGHAELIAQAATLRITGSAYSLHRRIDERRARRWAAKAEERAARTQDADLARRDPALANASLPDLVAQARTTFERGSARDALPAFALAQERLADERNALTPDEFAEFRLDYIRALRTVGMHTAATHIFRHDDITGVPDPRILGDIAIEVAGAHYRLGHGSAKYWVDVARGHYERASHQLGVLHTKSLARTISDAHLQPPPGIGR